MAFPTDTDHGVALWRGVNGYTGMYVQSATTSKSFETVEYAKDSAGTTVAVHQGNAKLDASWDALVFELTTPPVPGTMIEYTSYLTGTVSNWIVMKTELRSENSQYSRFSITLEAYPEVTTTLP